MSLSQLRCVMNSFRRRARLPNRFVPTFTIYAGAGQYRSDRRPLDTRLFRSSPTLSLACSALLVAMVSGK
jgi:hypothetical protein